MTSPQERFAEASQETVALSARLQELARIKADAIREMRAAGMRPHQISEITGLSRQRLDQLTRTHPAPEPGT